MRLKVPVSGSNHGKAFDGSQKWMPPLVNWQGGVWVSGYYNTFRGLWITAVYR